MLKGKNQVLFTFFFVNNNICFLKAFVEYLEEKGASNLVQLSNACPMAIRGKTIFCQYSMHQEIKTNEKQQLTTTNQQQNNHLIEILNDENNTVGFFFSDLTFDFKVKQKTVGGRALEVNSVFKIFHLENFNSCPLNFQYIHITVKIEKE